jgi:histidinol dehydrogenase
MAVLMLVVALVAAWSMPIEAQEAGASKSGGQTEKVDQKKQKALYQYQKKQEKAQAKAQRASDKKERKAAKKYDKEQRKMIKNANRPVKHTS